WEPNSLLSRLLNIISVFSRFKHLLYLFFSLFSSTGSSVRGKENCNDGSCVTFSKGEIKAEAGLCVVIPCSFKTSKFTPKHLVFYKCESSKRFCTDSDVIFDSDRNSNKVQAGFVGRVSLLKPDVRLRNCGIIINDLTESDSGSYQLRVNGLKNGRENGLTFPQKINISVKGLTQKPTVGIPPLTEGQQTTLSCTAPGLCSGSDPEITWTWRGAGEKDSHITGNITAVKTEHLTSVTRRHISTLTFKPSAEHRSTNVTCKVRFTNDVTTEETETLNVTCHGPCAERPWMAVAVISLIVNIICMILFLWNTRNKVTPNQEDRTYMSLQKIDQSPEYDVIARPLN
uniref:Ig-like domain-containing protein n=1 Tax=Gasterosteus aculeatus aculeatus TaxID=481459 RepID=A0AAQ4NN30_GASAC